MYTRGQGPARLLVGVYVDDLIITGAADDEIDKFKAQMLEEFRMSDLGLLSFYLGIEVQQGADGIAVAQTAYADKLLEQAGMVGCNPCQTPMESRLKLSKASTAAATDATAYRSIVGGLRYLVHTRPDLAYAVGYVSRFMEKPTVEHLAAVKHILRYVAGTRTLGCFLARGDMAGEQLTGTATVTWRATSTIARAPQGCCSSLALARSVGSQGSRRWWRCRPVRPSTSRPLLQLSRASGSHGCLLSSPEKMKLRQF